MSGYRSARCILYSRGRFLLAQHNNRRPENIGKWGLPGGHIDEGETPEAALRREIREEFRISELGELMEIGDWKYRGNLHKVFSTEFHDEILDFDRNEILDLKWCTFSEIEKMDSDGQLHTGFELAAMTRLRVLSGNF